MAKLTIEDAELDLVYKDAGPRDGAVLLYRWQDDATTWTEVGAAERGGLQDHRSSIERLWRKPLHAIVRALVSARTTGATPPPQAPSSR